MKQKKHVSAAVSALVLGLVPLVASATWMSQTIPLVEGWNAVHIKVNPYEYSCEKVFGGGGVDQVSWWNLDLKSDGTGLLPKEMSAWYAGDAAPSEFGSVLGDERYLVHAVAATNLVIFGTPAIPSGKVILGKLNLLGLNIPNTGTVSCYDYFRYMTDHLGPSPYYTQDPTDVEKTLAQRPGEAIGNASKAFWVSTVGEGTMIYKGALETAVDTGEKILSWATSTAAREITVKNVTPTNRLVRFELEPSLVPPQGQGTKAGDIKLKVESIDWTHGYARRVYTPVAFPFTTNVAAGATFTFRVCPDLDAMPESSGDYMGILVVSDKGAMVDEAAVPNGTCETRIGLKAAGSLSAEVEPTGLWVGPVVLAGVNRAKLFSSAYPEWNATNVQDASQSFQFRLILHVADDGTTKLLKQAFVGSNAANNETPAILTDKESAVAYREKYKAATIRRVSSANFPFMEPKKFTGGDFMDSKTPLTCTFAQPYDAKDNPFQHGFHPEHDNVVFNNAKPSVNRQDGSDGIGSYESWGVTRTITLKFADEDPTGPNEDWNRTVCGGTYTEAVTGLHKVEIVTEGAFRLSKTVSTPELMSGGVIR